MVPIGIEAVVEAALRAEEIRRGAARVRVRAAGPPRPAVRVCAGRALAALGTRLAGESA